MDVTLVSKPNTTALLWAYFGFKLKAKGEPENLEEAICRLCNQAVFIRSIYGPTAHSSTLTLLRVLLIND